MKCAILISLYNAEKTLDRTFDSLREQTFQDFRIIAINDRSTDRTAEMLSVWQKSFGKERFLLIENEKNIGLTRSLNRGLAAISEPYTARIDADDWWHPEKLARQMNYLESDSKCGVLGCDYENISGQKSKSVLLPKTDQEIKRVFFRRNPFAHSCIVFRTNLVKSIGGYSESVRYGQDYDLWLRLLPLTNFANLPSILCFRNTEDTLTTRSQKEQMMQSVRTQWKYLRLYRRPAADYLGILEPLIIAFTPASLRALKRKYFP